MQTTKQAPQTNSSVKKELLRLFEEDEIVRQKLAEITRDKHTEEKFNRVLDELKADREREDKRWAATQKEWNAKWEENDKNWVEWRATQKEWNAKWEENQKEWNAKWEENEKKWEEWKAEQKEWNAKWKKNDKRLDEMLATIKESGTRHDAHLGALGARWGLLSEASFRNGLRAILEKSFKVKVQRYEDFDDGGVVHGRPDQVELDVIVYNDSLILCEIKSSMSKPDMYAFWRKKEFYESRHQRKANRLIVISPMVDPKALKVSEELGIEVYSYPDYIEMEK